MLVLSRKPTERIKIGNDIVITVVKIAGHSVRLGIDAPREMRIVREEIAERVDSEAVVDLSAAA